MSETGPTGATGSAVLNRYRPPREEGYLSAGADPVADDLLARITATGSDHRPQRAPRPAVPRRLRWGAIAASALVVTGTGVAVAIVALTSPDDPTLVSCWSGPDAASNTRVAVVADPDIAPVDQCAALWTDGPLGTFDAGDVPALVACINQSGLLAVVPGEPGVCVAAGLVAATPVDDATAESASGLVAEISRRWADRCIDDDTARAELDALFAELGLEGWQVVSEVAGDQCVTAAVEFADRRIRLVELP